jgi:hypothetical protein
LASLYGTYFPSQFFLAGSQFVLTDRQSVLAGVHILLSSSWPTINLFNCFNIACNAEFIVDLTFDTSFNVYGCLE